MTSLQRVLLIGLLVLLSASQVSRVTAGKNVWTSNGPGGGQINALAIDPTAPATLYAGTELGGVFKSTNGAGNWSSVNTGLPDSSISALVIDPLTPATLYAGTIYGVFKSINGGGNWSAVNAGLINPQVWALAIDPKTPTTLYAAVNGGVFKSTDGGKNWSDIGLHSWVMALAIDPVTPAILYAGSYGEYLLDGVSKSTDGGMNWSNIGLSYIEVIALAIDPKIPTTLYAGTDWNGAFKSTDGGENWSPINIGLSTDYYFRVMALAIDPSTPDTLYAGTWDGVYKSTDGGGNWSAFNTGLTDPIAWSLAIDPFTPTTLYAGTYTGEVYAIQQIPGLVINYSSGAPGSYFTLTGSNYPPNATATVTINGNTVGTVLTDSSGGLFVLLKTSPKAGEGFYRVTASVPPGAITQFTLDLEGGVRPKEGSGTEFDVPDGIAYRVVYLPLIMK